MDAMSRIEMLFLCLKRQNKRCNTKEMAYEVKTFESENEKERNEFSRAKYLIDKEQRLSIRY